MSTEKPNYVYGPRTGNIPANLNFGDFIMGRMLDYGDKLVLINGETDERFTYRQLAEKAMSVAVSLVELGVKKGDTVALCSENRPEYWSSLIGVICSGATITTINPGYAKDELIHVLGICKPKYIICSQNSYNVHRHTIKNLTYIKKTIIYGEKSIDNAIVYNTLSNKTIDPTKFLSAEVSSGDDTVAVLYSSGTTGLPKGVMLTHLNLLAMCCLQGPLVDVEVISLLITPWYHSMGFGSVLTSLNLGRTMVYLPRFQEKLYLETIQKYKPVVISVVPPIVVVLAKSTILKDYDLSSIAVIGCGAAPLDSETGNAIKEKMPNLAAVVQGYGMTEATFAVLRTPEIEVLNTKDGSVGRPLSWNIIKVVDIDTGEVLGPNRSGEIRVKGPTLMKGYVGIDSRDSFDEEGFYKTGDIGYYDEDKIFFIVDRIKELIKYKAHQVPPAEIEALLLQHPGVKDAGVIGLPNKEAGEVPLAFVVKVEDSDVTEEELIKYVASKLSNAKHLRGGVRFIREIPKNPSGKILRRFLRDLAKNKKSKL